jgi:hypothetical protein
MDRCTAPIAGQPAQDAISSFLAFFTPTIDFGHFNKGSHAPTARQNPSAISRDFSDCRARVRRPTFEGIKIGKVRRELEEIPLAIPYLQE